MGRFTMAAKHHVNIAELYESDTINIEKAIINFEKVSLSIYLYSTNENSTTF